MHKTMVMSDSERKILSKLFSVVEKCAFERELGPPFALK